MSIVELYDLHINPNSTGLDLYNLFRSFEIDYIVIKNPDPELNKIEEVPRLNRIEMCKQWIFQNSKLTSM